ncbi:MAG: NAD(P)/FAD-dependent oxidoreductase [Anaerolineae bacterium]|nr:NAD(P)/FAD-dependent oxidoreductase [Anaerolineae bacterium]
MKHVIVGNGVAGVTAAQVIRRADADAEVHLFGAEPYPYYRRPQLWEFIAGQIEQDALYYRPAEWYAERGIELHLGTEVTELDPTSHQLAFADGSQATYDRLLLATGARPFIPPCEGTEKDGVFTLRTLDDALAIKAYAREVDTAVVIGGGLLGLETARALHTAGLEVTVAEFFPYLLPRQLDEEGAQVLQSLLEAQGLYVVTGATTTAILGVPCADCIQLQSGAKITGDLVLFSTGIRSEVTLAKQVGLEVNRGVIVDGHLQTSVDDVFAAGDAAEFEGVVYGIIPPAIEQARVAAANMVTPGSATYTGTLPTTTLKVAGAELTTLGEAVVEGEEYTQLRHTDAASGHYRKIVLRGGRIVGAILLNDRERTQSLRQLVGQGADVSAYADHLLDDDFDLKSLI